jgi:hypothetical protein
VIFRREPIHKKLAREARLEERPGNPPLVDPGPHWGVTGIHGVPRPRHWDAVASAEAPGLTGGELHFVALPDGDLIVDEDEPADTLAPLAEAIEQTIEAPYRAEAVRRHGDVWAVAARRVRIASFEADGEELELVAGDEGRRLTVDGEPAHGTISALEELGREESEAYVARARRLEGSLWEVETDPL